MVLDVQQHTRFPTWTKLLQERAAQQGEQNAFLFLTDGERQEDSLTYAQLDRRAHALAARLRSAHESSSRVMLLYPPGLEFAVGLFGCWYAGMIAVPAYPPRSAHHAGSLATLQGIAADAQPSVILTTARSQTMIQAATRAVPALANAPVIASDDASVDLTGKWREPDIAGESLACLQYTSGSTSAPKGVMLTHANLLHNSAIIRECFGHGSASRGVIWLPPFHDMGLIGGILQPVYSGFPVTLMAPAAFLQRPLRWLEAISRYGGTTSGGPNFAYELCIKHACDAELSGLNLSTWDVAFNGAEPIDPRTIERFTATFARCGFRREAFYPCYGLAESTLIVAGGEKAAAPVLQSISPAAMENHQAVRTEAGEESKTFVGCGRPHFDAAIEIVDPATRLRCPAGRIGEIWTRGSSVARGYWRNAEATAEVFEARLADSNEGPFLRTGDLGFIDNNELFITGRLKDLIIIRGRNHYPHDIEHVAQESHAALRPDCGAAFAVESDGTESLVIVQELERTQRDSDPEAIIGAIRQAVAETHEVQVSVVVLLKPGGVPKTSSGKIRRRACREAFLKGDLEPVAQWVQPAAPLNQGEAAAPANAQSAGASLSVEQIEDVIVTKLAGALHVSPDEIDPAEPFARYGLDSAGAVELAGALENELGRELPGTLFYDYPSARDLARHLAGEVACVQAGH
jgi:acyl-CoA synthetase (AMP-forming)/AMP-acid ligase II/acyl carrier protein